jgi:hypothetical protein
MRERWGDMTMASSRAKDQVRREAVCWAPVMAKRVMMAITMVKNVATGAEEVAW